MSKFYGLYGTIIVALFIAATYQGYAFNSLFGNSHHSANTAGATHFYHK
jgi:hypothetical protein